MHPSREARREKENKNFVCKIKVKQKKGTARELSSPRACGNRADLICAGGGGAVGEECASAAASCGRTLGRRRRKRRRRGRSHCLRASSNCRRRPGFPWEAAAADGGRACTLPPQRTAARAVSIARRRRTCPDLASYQLPSARPCLALGRPLTTILRRHS